jgi:MATE family multidrug resistance protein
MGGGLACFMMMTLVMGLTGYTTALVAQYFGAGRKDRCATATTQAVLLCLVAYPLILLARPLVFAAFEASRIDPEQLAFQKTYFGILIYATLAGLLRTTLSGFFSGIGRTRIVMVASIAAMVVNIAMNYILIFGKFGLPAMGVRGAAYGTIIGGVFGLAVLVAAYFGGPNRRRYGVAGSLRFDREAMGKLLRFGYPGGIEMFLNVLAFNAMVVAFHAHGPATATAVTILFNWDMVSFVPLIGVQIGVMSLVGRYMGAGSPDTAHRATISGLKIGWMYSSLILVLFAVFPRHLVAMFRPGQAEGLYDQAVPMAVYMIRLASVYVMVEAVVVVFSGALRGAGDTVWAMCISLSIHWVILPIPIVMMHVLGTSPESAWTALVCAFMLLSGLFYFRYRTGRWREIRVVQPIPVGGDHEFHEPADL